MEYTFINTTRTLKPITPPPSPHRRQGNPLPMSFMEFLALCPRGTHSLATLFKRFLYTLDIVECPPPLAMSNSIAANMSISLSIRGMRHKLVAQITLSSPEKPERSTHRLIRRKIQETFSHSTHLRLPSSWTISALTIKHYSFDP